MKKCLFQIHQRTLKKSIGVSKKNNNNNPDNVDNVFLSTNQHIEMISQGE